MLGTVLGQYRITGSIGRGGMGVVYAAEHVLLRRPAAVKVLVAELSRNEEVVTRFFNEARAATSIRHPGIVEIYDFGFHVDGSAYIAMEHLQGESLAARMARGRIPPASVLALLRQLAGALGAAHAKGIVHRDLKPDNIFLVPDPEVPGGERIKLLDFGIAKLVAEQGHGQTRTGAVMGTPTYMAPEQCRGVAVDHRADLYSLGCILFELCAGRPPFVGEGTGDVLAAHIHVPPPAMSAFAYDVPPALEQLVQQLLVKDPSRRLQSALELITAIDLSNAQLSRASMPMQATSPHAGAYAAPTTPPTTLSGASRSLGAAGYTQAPVRSKALIFGAIGVIVAAAVLIAIVATRGGDKSARSGEVAAASNLTPATDAAAMPAVAPATETPTVVAPAPIAVAPDAAVAVTPPAGVAPPPPPAVASTIPVTVESTPAGADIVLGTTVLGKTPYRGTLPRADQQVTLVVRLAGYADQKLTASPNAPIAETVTLDKKHPHVVAPRPKKNRDDSVNPFDN